MPSFLKVPPSVRLLLQARWSFDSAHPAAAASHHLHTHAFRAARSASASAARTRALAQSHVRKRHASAHSWERAQQESQQRRAAEVLLAQLRSAEARAKYRAGTDTRTARLLGQEIGDAEAAGRLHADAVRLAALRGARGSLARHPHAPAPARIPGNATPDSTSATTPNGQNGPRAETCGDSKAINADGGPVNAAGGASPALNSPCAGPTLVRLERWQYLCRRPHDHCCKAAPLACGLKPSKQLLLVLAVWQ